jgi:hypothetical protein
MRKTMLRIVAIAALLISLCADFDVSAQNRRRHRRRSTQPPATVYTPLPAPPPQPTTRTLVSSEFAVPPGYFYTTQFSIPAGTVGHVYGRFRATGGDNIKVHLMNSDGYENFQHGSEYLTYYSSGKVTVGTIDVRLGEGSYYLVFENKYSVVSNKIVRADVFLEY